jgi:methyl-accepting chemotaxis protein
MEKKRYKRNLRHYLIHKEIQLKIVLTNLAYTVIILTITLAVLLSPLLHDMFFSNNLDVQYQAAQTFLTLIKRLVPAVVLMFILVFVHQVLITHRICGPLVNFSHTFRRIAEGDFTRKVYLRKGDYLREECERINAIVDSLARSIGNIRINHGELVSLLEEAMAQVGDFETKEKLAEAIDIIKRQADLVRKDLAIFKLKEL